MKAPSLLVEKLYVLSFSSTVIAKVIFFSISSMSNVKVNVTKTKIVVRREMSCHMEYTCGI